MKLSPSPYFARRAPTLERTLLMRCIGHPTGCLDASNDDPEPLFALSHCLTCSESPHGGWVAGPCGFAGCELNAAGHAAPHTPGAPHGHG